MVDLYHICLYSVSAFHILFGLGNLLKLPPLYDPSTWLVVGKPGTGATEIEKLLEFIFGLWYTGSITGVLLAKNWAPEALRGALICPLYYHATVAIVAFLFLDKFKICNPVKSSGVVAGVMHTVMAGMLAYIFCLT